jgi:DUF4097 and DUF4098 domain-containing protein YvlB
MKRPLLIVLLSLALALVCLGIGAVVFFAANRGFPTNSPFDNRNISSVLEESKTLKVDTKKPIDLKVLSAAGEVTVTGADVDSIQLKAVKTAYDSTQARADQEVKTIKYAVEQTGNQITLRYEIPDSMNFNNKVNTVDFILTVPAKTNIDVDAGFGEISVSNIDGEVALVNDLGEVTAKSIRGRLHVETQSGAVTASSIDAGSQDIELTSGFGKVSLKEASSKEIRLTSQSGVLQMSDVRASGDVTMATDFGDASFDGGSAGALEITTKSGKVTLKDLNLRGALTARTEFGEIGLEQVKAASYDLETNSGSVTADGVLGKVRAHSGFGSVTVTRGDAVTLDLSTKSGPVSFEGSLGKGPHTVTSDFGEISLTLPADSALDVDLKTNFGSIKSEIPMTVTLTGELENGRQTGTMNNGGEPLTVETGSGSISIQASH